MRALRALVAGAAGLAFAAGACAESALNNAGSGSAAARLNFRVVVPYIIYFAVGPGATGPRTPNAAISTLSFDYTGAAATVGNGTASAAASVPVRLYCNAGATTISVSHPANLVSGSDTIPFTQILATSADPTNFPVPTMGGAAVNPPVNGASSITNRNSTWSFRYANQARRAPGTYTGQVTYTAALL